MRRLDDVSGECMWGFLVRVHVRLMVLLYDYNIVLRLYCLPTCGIPVAWTRIVSRTCTVFTRLVVDRPWFVAQHKKPVLLLQLSETDAFNYYNWLLFFLLVSYLLPLSLPCLSTPQTSPIYPTINSVFLPYNTAGLRLPPPIVLFCIIPWSIKHCSSFPVPPPPPTRHTASCCNSSNHGPPPLPTALPITPLPINQFQRSYWLTKHPGEFSPPTVFLCKLCVVVGRRSEPRSGSGRTPCSLAVSVDCGCEIA